MLGQGTIEKSLTTSSGVGVESAVEREQKGFEAEKDRHSSKVLNGKTECLEIYRDGLNCHNNRDKEGRCYQHLMSGAEMLNLPQGMGPIHAAHGVTLSGAGETSSHQLPYLTKGQAGLGARCWMSG